MSRRRAAVAAAARVPKRETRGSGGATTLAFAGEGGVVPLPLAIAIGAVVVSMGLYM